MPTMDCNKWTEQLNDYLDGLLEAEDTKAFEAHMNSCASCKEEFELYKAMMAVLHSTEDVELPEDFHADLMEKVEAEAVQDDVSDKANKVIPFRKRVPRSFVNIAAGLVLVTVLVLFGNQFNRYSEDSAVYESANEAPAATEKAKEAEVEEFAIEEEAAPAMKEESAVEEAPAAAEKARNIEEKAAEPALMMEAPATEQAGEGVDEAPAAEMPEMAMEEVPAEMMDAEESGAAEVFEAAVEVEDVMEAESEETLNGQLEMTDVSVETDYAATLEDSFESAGGTDSGSTGAKSDDGREVTLKTSAPEENGFSESPWLVLVPFGFAVLAAGALIIRFRKSKRNK